ncbi:MAG TPA: hypothetical protein PK011_15365, partial [Marinagarivorans sp.]|nr:hypothetical protein [Marinagarivorans sp.]
MPKLFLSPLFFSVLLFSVGAVADGPLIPAPPTIAAPAYLLMDATSGSVLLEQNADVQRPPASLTKMMTSYIAVGDVEKGKLKETDLVHVSEDAWQRIVGTKRRCAAATGEP